MSNLSLVNFDFRVTFSVAQRRLPVEFQDVGPRVRAWCRLPCLQCMLTCHIFRTTTADIVANAAPMTMRPSIEGTLHKRCLCFLASVSPANTLTVWYGSGEWSHLFTTDLAAPRSEDCSNYYPFEIVEGPRPIHDEVKGYLKMREAKLMEELWRKEKDMERKVGRLACALHSLLPVNVSCKVQSTIMLRTCNKSADI